LRGNHRTLTKLAAQVADLVSFLWLAIFATIVAFYKISRPAAYLLLPYILWVSFAAYLNLMIRVLN
ncbi:MAG: TspO/MBR family protein, partial [Candidatus Colwellbacteria bacterium]